MGLGFYVIDANGTWDMGHPLYQLLSLPRIEEVKEVAKCKVQMEVVTWPQLMVKNKSIRKM